MPMKPAWARKGKNWWLWVFGTHDAAFFTVDKSSGGVVVRRVLERNIPWTPGCGWLACL